MDCTTQNKPHKRVSFKKDHLVVVHPQHEDQRVSIFELRSSKLAPNNSSGVRDYNPSTSSKNHGDKAASDRAPRDGGGDRPYCLHSRTTASNSAPLKSILKKKDRTESFQKVADSWLEYVDNRSSLGLRGSTRENTTISKTLPNTTAPISSLVQDKSIFSRSQTSSQFTPGQRTEAQEPLNLKVSCAATTTTTGRSTTSNHSVQSSRSAAAQQGKITIIRPLSGVTHELALNRRTRPETSYRSAIKAASLGSDRDLNVVGIPMSISDLYPALEKLQNSVEKMADRTEKLYKDMLTHSAVTTAGAEMRNWKRTQHNDSREKIDPTILQRSYSSVNSSSAGSWNMKPRMAIINPRTDYSSDGYQRGRAAMAAWQPGLSSYRLPAQNESRFNSSAGRTGFSGLHKSPGRKC